MFYSICLFFSFFFFNDTATTEIYTLSLHDALPIWSGGSGSSDSPPRLLLRGLPLRRRRRPRPSRLRRVRRPAPPLGLERPLHVCQHAIPLVGADQPAPHGVAHQLFGVVERELAHAGGGADRLDERVGHRAAEDARDAGEGLEQRGDLRPAELSWGGRGGHRTRCSGAEGRAKLHPPLGTVKDFGGNYRWDARLGGRRWRSAAARRPGARREMVRSECDNSSPSTVRVR